MSLPLRIAIVGAGLSGLRCARTLHESGAQVAVFDKSRGPAGRMSTRRGEGWQCDHGAQYFTARDPRFHAEVMRWVQAGVAAPWRPRWAVVDEQGVHAHVPTVERFVGTPRMTSPAQWLAQGLTLHLQHTVNRLVPSGGVWQLHTAEHGVHAQAFDAVVLALPAPQVLPLVQGVVPEAAALAHHTPMRGSWAAMLRFAHPVPLGFDAAFVNHGPLRWVARDRSKPGRTGPETWLLHGQPEWSEAHLEWAPQDAAAALVQAFVALGGVAPTDATAHRWRYADTSVVRQEGWRWWPKPGLGLCGDWLNGGQVQGAWLSGQGLAQALLGSPAPAPAPDFVRWAVD